MTIPDFPLRGNTIYLHVIRDKWKKHTKRYIMFFENVGPHLSLDETALSQGELYTEISNKKTKGKKNALVLIIVGKLRILFNDKDKGVAFTKLAHWYKDVEDTGFKAFNTTVANKYTAKL